jgi:hypothetical protein
VPQLEIKMKTYYPGDNLPDGYYWVYDPVYKEPWIIKHAMRGRFEDFRGEYLDAFDGTSGEKATGPLEPPIE